MEYKYVLVNTNKPLSYVMDSTKLNVILNEILVAIDDSLGFMINNGIKMDVGKLNFDNYQCLVYTSNYSGISPYITKKIVFDINRSWFYDHNDILVDYDQSLNFIFSTIKSKLSKIGNETTSDNSQPKKSIQMKSALQKVDPIKQLFTETNELIKKSNVTVIKPDVLRPMNSIVTENKPDILDLESGDVEFADISLDMLEETMKSLEALKNKEKNELSNLKQNIDKELDTFSQQCNDLGDVRRNHKRNKDREEQRKNRFIANTEAYAKIKEDIMAGKLQENKISESIVFKEEYPIFKFMDQNDLLDKDDSYDIYLSIYDEMYVETKPENKEYVPHNINYLSEEDQKKFSHIKNDTKDMIDNFIGNKKPKSYPSVEEVLESIDNDPDDLDEFDSVTFEKNDDKVNTIANALKTAFD